MNKILKEKISESVSSVLPITIIVLLLSVTITPMPVGTMVLFLTGAALLIVGMALFSLGTDVSMTPMGEGIGAQLPRTKNLFIVILITFIIGVLITIAEPDLQVLAGQVPSIPNNVLIWTVAVGVGLFFVLAMLRTLFKIRLSLLLIVFYAVVFILSAFVPNEFVSVAFDSGGVTTGPVTVPFIMALGVGLASIRGDSGAQEDSFGLVALCSIGPVLAVLLLGIFYPDKRRRLHGSDPCRTCEDTRQAAHTFVVELPAYIHEVLSALVPIILFCAVFQLIFRRFHAMQLSKNRRGFCVHIYRSVAVSDRCKRRIYARGPLSRTAAGAERTGMGAGAAWHAHRLFSGNCGAGCACAQPAGRVHHKRRHLAESDDAQPVHRRGLLGRHGYASRIDRHFNLLYTGAGLSCRTGTDFLRAENFHRHCI